jgi:autotransporter-associated beta strand protein
VNSSGGLGTYTTQSAVEAAANLIRDKLATIPGVVPIADVTSDGVQNSLDLLKLDKLSGTNQVLGATYLMKFQPTFTVTKPFNLGVNFLNLQASGTVTFNGQLTLLLGFGINKTDGFFIKTDFSDIAGAGLTSSTPELSLTGGVSIDGPGVNLKLGLLDLTANFDETGAEDDFLTANFIGNLNGGSDGKLTLSDLLNLANFSSLATVGLIVQAKLNVPLSVNVSNHPELPSLGATFTLDWGPFNVVTSPATTPVIHLADIHLNAGSFVDTVVKPLLQKLKDNTPLGPVTDALTDPLPLVNRTPYELLKATLPADSQARKVLDFLFKIVDFINEAESTAGSAANQDVHFGSITIGQGSSANGPQPTATPDAGSKENGQESSMTTPTVPGAALPIIGPYIQKLADLGITVPVLQLSKLSQLLIGNNVDLVVVNLPKLDVKKDFNINYPLFNFGIPYVADVSINAFFGGGFELIVDLSAGFDTRGLRSGHFLNGFYIGDFDPGSDNVITPTDKERFELQFTANVHAGIDAQVDLIGLPVGKATGQTSITATIGVDLNEDNEDPTNGLPAFGDGRSATDRHDGRVYLDEIGTILSTNANDPLCLFDASGQLNAALQISLDVIGVFHKDYHFSWPLLPFDLTCSSNHAVAANQNLADIVVDGSGNRTLVLTSTASASDDDKDTRAGTHHPDGDNVQILLVDKNQNPSDGPPLLVVNRQDVQVVTLTGTPTKFRVTGSDGSQFLARGLDVGQQVQYAVADIKTGFTKIVTGTLTEVTDNSFTVQPASNLPDGNSTTFTILSGRETLRVRKDGVFEDFGAGETGNHFIANVASFVLITNHGGGPLNGFGAGDDHVTVDPLVPTPVRFSGGLGNDILIGGGGDDVLLGGLGDDTLDGGGYAGPGGSSGRDTMIGGGGSDFIDGRDGDDTLVGDFDVTLDPRPTPNATNLPLFPFEGADVIHGGEGDDRIWGDNKGTANDANGPPPTSPLPTPDIIYPGAGNNLFFLGAGDQLAVEVNQPGTLQFDAQGQAVVLTPNSVSIAGQDPVEFGAVPGVVVINSYGQVIVNGTQSKDDLRVQVDGTGQNLFYSFASGPAVTIFGATSFQFNGSGGNDTFTVDLSNGGNPFPSGGLKFAGEANSTGRTLPILGGASGDRLIVKPGTGTDVASLSPSTTVSGNGKLGLGNSSVSFTGLESIEISHRSSLFVTPGDKGLVKLSGRDALTVQSGTASGGQPATVVSGTCVSARMPILTFFDIPNFTLDTGADDGFLTDDSVTVRGGSLLVGASALKDQGLQNVTIRTGNGADTLTTLLSDYRLPVTGGSFNFDGGAGVDTIKASADVSLTLNGNTALTNSGGGSIGLQNLAGEIAALTGGAGDNTFTVTNWTGSVTLNGGAGLDRLTLAIAGGSSATTLETLALTGNVSVGWAATPATLAGSLDLGGVSRTFTVTNGSAAPDLVISAAMGGTGGVTLAGGGKMVFSGNNTYTGANTVSAGALQAGAAEVIPDASDVTLAAGTTLGLDTFTETIGSLAGAGNITLARGPILIVGGNSNSTTFSGAISGVGGLTKIGIGQLTSAGGTANTYSGTTRVNAGTLALNKPTNVSAIPGNLIIGDGIGADQVLVLGGALPVNNQIAPTAAVTINSSGTLNLNGNVNTISALTMTGGSVTTGIGGLSLNGNVTATSAGATNPATISGTLSLGGATRTFIVSDGPAFNDLVISAVVSGAAGVGLTKSGAGRLALQGANTYPGLTDVTEGFLSVENYSALGATSTGTTVRSGAALEQKGGITVSEPLTLNGVGSGGPEPWRCPAASTPGAAT